MAFPTKSRSYPSSAGFGYKFVVLDEKTGLMSTDLQEVLLDSFPEKAANIAANIEKLGQDRIIRLPLTREQSSALICASIWRNVSSFKHPSEKIPYDWNLSNDASIPAPGKTVADINYHLFDVRDPSTNTATLGFPFHTILLEASIAAEKALDKAYRAANGITQHEYVSQDAKREFAKSPEAIVIAQQAQLEWIKELRKNAAQSIYYNTPPMSGTEALVAGLRRSGPARLGLTLLEYKNMVEIHLGRPPLTITELAEHIRNGGLPPPPHLAAAWAAAVAKATGPAPAHAADAWAMALARAQAPAPAPAPAPAAAPPPPTDADRQARAQAAQQAGWPQLRLSDIQLPEGLSADLYKGATAGDAQGVVDMLEERQDMSFCPVCHSYSARTEGCMYMRHECPLAQRHPLLFARYNVDGAIAWCTICGRICSGHRHYGVNDIGAGAPTLVPLAQGTSPFDHDCVPQGGGGFAEKVRRFHRLAAAMCLSEPHVNKIHDWVVHMSRIDYVWNADIAADPPGPFVVPCALPRRLEGVAANKNAPNIQPPADLLMPVTHRAPDNTCAIELEPHDDGRPVYQFRHNAAHAQLHAGEYICATHLQTTIDARPFDGLCSINPACREVLWPRELEGIFTDQQLTRYRRLFNQARRGQAGGNRIEFLRKMDDYEAQCAVPARNKKTRRSTKRRRTTRKK